MVEASLGVRIAYVTSSVLFGRVTFGWDEVKGMVALALKAAIVMTLIFSDEAVRDFHIFWS